MVEGLIRRILLGVALAGLAAGLALPRPGLPFAPDAVWTLATLPVVAMLAVSILRDVLIGRIGVDAIALVSMTAALLLGQPLAAVVVAVMYAGGSVLEDHARGRARSKDQTLIQGPTAPRAPPTGTSITGWRTSPSPRSPPATCSSCAPARSCRSTARSSTRRPPSTRPR